MVEPTKNAGQAAVSQEEITQALELLRKTREQRAKQREKAKNDPAAKEKASVRALRLRVKNNILIKKAIDAGIKVEDKEIDAFLAKK